MHIGGGGTKELVGMIRLVGAAVREEIIGNRTFDGVDEVENEAVTNDDAMDSGEKDDMWVWCISWRELLRLGV